MILMISNKYQEELKKMNLDFKIIFGEYDVFEMIEIIKNFSYEKMILDVTALKSFNNYKIYHTLKEKLDASKIIFLLPEKTGFVTKEFLSHLISYQIYNFTTNINGVLYLLQKSNTYTDVEYIIKEYREEIKSKSSKRIIGFKSITKMAGATKELSHYYGQDNIEAIEIGKNDFSYFKERNLISLTKEEASNYIKEQKEKQIILLDLGENEVSFCDEIVYLVEPTTINLKKIIQNKEFLEKLKNKKIILNKSLLKKNSVEDLEEEMKIKIFYNIPPLDERKRNAVITNFLVKLGLLDKKVSTASREGDKIFGLFRR